MKWLVLLLVLLRYSCHPECSHDNVTVCFAEGAPYCQPVVCSVTCPTNRPCQIKPFFHAYCPPDMCESDFCPECEILVDGLAEFCPFCNGTCHEIECAWYGTTPTDCGFPADELTCEPPACAYVP